MTPSQPASARQYEELVQAIVKAVPEIEYEKRSRRAVFGPEYPYGRKRFFIKERLRRPITLEDVLRTARETSLTVDVDGFFALDSKTDEHNYWHLGHSLEWHRDNAPETIQFLYSLLCPKK
jgi:hypothetical protein